MSLLGAAIFIVGGFGDMAWHTVFGVEEGIDSLLSPTHLTLVLAGSLIFTGPVRSAFRRSPNSTEWKTVLPVVLSVTFTFSVFTFFTQFVNPIAEVLTTMDAPDLQAIGVAGVLVQAALLMGSTLFITLRWRLPLGSLTIMFTLNVALMSVLQDTYILVIVGTISGVAADFLLWRLKPSAKRLTELRIFAMAVPAAFFGVYFLVLALKEGIAWPVELWAGSIILAGAVGLFLTFLVIPAEDTQITAPTS